MPIPEIERVQLLDAARNGNWKAVEELLRQNPHMALNSCLTVEDETSLHIATRQNRRAFVKKLVTHLREEDLALQTTGGDTALSIAAMSGFKDIAKIMIETRLIYDSDLQQSLFKALHCGHKEMVLYLFQSINININLLEVEDRSSLFVATVMNDIYDKALDILQNCQNLAHRRDDKRSKLTALQVLIHKPQDIFRSGVGNTIRYIWSWIRGEKDCKYSTVAYQLLEMIWDQYLMLEEESYVTLVYANPNLFLEAVKLGNVKFLSFLGKIFTIRKVREDDKKMLNVAISHRQEKIFNLIRKVGILEDYVNDFIDVADGNNMLHLAGKLPTVEELQMQRELFWFKKMQKIMPPGFKIMQNRNGLTPKDVFLKEHKDLIIADRTAMKETAKLYISLSTAICTIACAVLFIKPGSATTKGAAETPIFLKDTWSEIFSVSSIVAIIFSLLSIFWLLLIHASGYKNIEYIKTVRANRLGVTAFFISTVSIVIACMAAVFLMFDYKSAWVPPFSLAASLAFPVIFLLSLGYLHY